MRQAWQVSCFLVRGCLSLDLIGALAQLGERVVRNDEVSGSIPLGSTKNSKFQLQHLTLPERGVKIEHNMNKMIRAAPHHAMRCVLQECVTGERSSGFYSMTLGDKGIDGRLRGRLAKAALHEVYGAATETSSAAAFALMLALRGCALGAPILWVREDHAARHGRLYAHGLAELGADPDQIVIIHAPDARTALRAGADIARCSAVGAVLIELHGKVPLLDLTASRRLALAAAQSGVLVLLLRIGAEPQASAAQTRWQVESAPSALLAANAPGAPAFIIELLRHRGGVAGFRTRIEWNRDDRNCIEAPLPGAAFADALIGTGEARKAA